MRVELLGVLALAGGAAAQRQYCDGGGGLQTAWRMDSDPSCASECSGCSTAQVLAAIAAAPDGSDVQKNGCWALGILARDSLANRVAIAAAGGIEAAMGAMARFPAEDGDVQKYGCWALGGLARGSLTNAAAIGAAGGRALASAALAAHTAHTVDGWREEEVQTYCQSALDVIPLAGGAAAQQQFCDGSGGLQTAAERSHSDPSCAGDCSGCSAAQVLTAMEAAPEDAAVQRFGCAALANLAYDSPANRAAITDAGGIEAAAGAMARLPEDWRVQEDCQAAVDSIEDDRGGAGRAVAVLVLFFVPAAVAVACARRKITSPEDRRRLLLQTKLTAATDIEAGQEIQPEARHESDWLKRLLSKSRLGKFEKAFRGAQCVDEEDIRAMGRGTLSELGLNSVQAKRLQRTIAPQPIAAVAAAPAVNVAAAPSAAPAACDVEAGAEAVAPPPATK
jgi:hypothetical protein